MGEDGEVSGMAMTVIWTGMVVVSILCGLATGNGPAVAAAAMEGAAAAGELCPVSFTQLRAPETRHDLGCRLFP